MCAPFSEIRPLFPAAERRLLEGAPSAENLAEIPVEVSVAGVTST